jgi:GNAT superfamily N-acetyltransferase
MGSSDKAPAPLVEGRGEGAVSVVPVTDAAGSIVNADMLVAAEGVHRQLRAGLPDDYVARMKEVFASGAEMAVAIIGSGVAGITVFRVLEKTFTGRELYCDDLVTDETQRSRGVGHALIEYMERVGHERGCDVLALDSGTHRREAHRFYFREGLSITSFHFRRKL